MTAEIILWGSIAFMSYAYFGYPLALQILAAFISRPVKKANICPSVSFIITAYNEEGRIREKIENTLKQDYPSHRLEIMVASDCSTDGTDAIVRSYASYGVRLVRVTERKGKEAAQKHAVHSARGDILVFSDVATMLSSNGVSSIVKSFYDPTVGCVSSMDRLVDADGALSGEGAYVRYEMFLRSLESRVNSLVGLSGSFFAARREACRGWAIDLQSDFLTVLNSVKEGRRGVLDHNAVGYYRNVADDSKEFQRKVRTVSRGISVFMKSLPLLNPFRYGLFSWQLFSHKLCRWLVPVFMIAAFLSNALVIPVSTVYAVTFIVQASFYTLACAGFLASRVQRQPFLRIPSYFVLVNLSVINGWYQYLKGDRLIRWHPSIR